MQRLSDKDFEERFWRQVQLGGNCWVFTGKISPDGYGVFYSKKNGQVTWRAHRFSWMIHNGAIPDGMHVCHTCDNPWCVNPDHLWLGTAHDNALDRESKGRGATVGARNANAKLTEAQVIEILRSDGTTLALGEKYGVHPTAISNIRSGKRWKNITIDNTQNQTSDTQSGAEHTNLDDAQQNQKTWKGVVGAIGDATDEKDQSQ